jgi:hypothetical protein
MDILGLVSELPIKTVGICLLRVRCGGETGVNVCVIKQIMIKWEQMYSKYRELTARLCEIFT